MSKIGIIVKREYMRRVAKKSFILLTFLMPFLFAALVTVPLMLSKIQDSEVRNVVVLDQTNLYEKVFEDTESYRFIIGDKSLEEYRASEDRSISVFITIKDNLLKDPTAMTMYSEQQIPISLKSLVETRFNVLLTNEKIKSYNIPDLDKIIAEAKVSVDISTIKWGKDGENIRSSSEIAGIIGMVFTIIIYMFIMSYGGMVMQGVMEEKTNRIVEVMVSSVKPFELMMGKIIGIALVGLTQLMMWVVLTMALFFVGTNLLGLGVDASQVGMEMSTMPKPSRSDLASFYEILNSINLFELVLMFIIYFLGGYLLYASVFAAIGSSVENQEDTQQFMTPIMILLIFALYAGIYSMENPNGPLALWSSFIPFTSPVVMMVRTPFDVPLWQQILSIALLYATAIVIVWISAKIYRVGILMYGKKPSFKEMIKWIKYK